MEREISVKEWIKTIIILVIPIVNIGFLLYWAFKSNDYHRNYSRAILLMVSISLLGGLVLGGLGNIIYPNENTAKVEANENRYNASTDFVSRWAETEKALQNDIEIIQLDFICEETWTHEEGGTIFARNVIEGKIKNTSDTRTYDNFVIVCNVYDEDDSVLGTISIELFNKVLPPGEVLKFKEQLGQDFNYYFNGSVKFIEIQNPLI